MIRSLYHRIIDVTAYIVFGHFPIGTSSYVAWPETSWAELVSTMHHVWFLPLVFAVLYRNSHLPFGILKYSFFVRLSSKFGALPSGN
jgi:hypothetical protein